MQRAVKKTKRMKLSASSSPHEMIRVRGAREHNLQDVDVDIPREALVVFSGVSGSGKSSLAFGTVFAEAQRRFLESVAPYARRLFDQIGVPEVDTIDGLPPAIALRQQRGAPSVRSSVGSVTTISNLLRLLYSRAGCYPARQPLLHAEEFSPNTPQGACSRCHGLGTVYDVTEARMVPDTSLTIRERAVAAWPTAWQGQNLRDILVTLGHSIDTPWRELPRRTQRWILYTDEQPTVPVFAGFSADEVRAARKRKLEPSYMGTFIGVRAYVLRTFATTQSALMKKRVSPFLTGVRCPLCRGRRLKKAALSVTVAGKDIGSLSQISLSELVAVLSQAVHPVAVERRIAAERIVDDIMVRVAALQSLGLGYLTLERSTTTLSAGELQRLRLATQMRSNLFGVVFVLDEPSAGLHPADNQALFAALDELISAGNSVCVVEHDLAIMARADWLIDVGPDGGTGGGHIVYSGPPEGLRNVAASRTAPYLFGTSVAPAGRRREPTRWLELRDVTRNTLRRLTVRIPLGALTMVTGVSGSGKSSLVSQALVELVALHLGQKARAEEFDVADEPTIRKQLNGRIATGGDGVRRLVTVDQRPIGRTPRSNLATYTGLFDHVRRLFAGTRAARAKRYSAGRFSFNMTAGQCATCEGEGSVHVELIFLSTVYAPCPTCRGARYNPATLRVRWNGKSIAEVLTLTVAEAFHFFAGEAAIVRTLALLMAIGLDYLRLGQPATELSGGEAQRIKLASELQRSPRRDTLYVLDEPTTGLHPADADRLLEQLQGLVDHGNTVVVVEHDMRVVASSDWVIDMGPGAGDAGGQIVASGPPESLRHCPDSRTAPYLMRWLDKAATSVVPRPGSEMHDAR